MIHSVQFRCSSTCISLLSLFVHLSPENWAWPAHQRHGNMTPSCEAVAVAGFSRLVGIGFHRWRLFTGVSAVRGRATVGVTGFVPRSYAYKMTWYIQFKRQKSVAQGGVYQSEGQRFNPEPLHSTKCPRGRILNPKSSCRHVCIIEVYVSRFDM